jgi:hypothetical protein
MLTQTNKCKNCQKDFVIEYNEKGSGSKAKLQRSLCSNECRCEWQVKQAKLDVQTTGKISTNCVICNKQFWIYPSHIAGHITCSKECANKNRSLKARKHKIIDINCKTCGKLFSVKENSKRKFCSPLCFSNDKKKNRVHYNCVICNKEMEVRKSHYSESNKCCSKLCQNQAQSRGLIIGHVQGGKAGYRLDIENSPYFKSSFEADYYRYCLYKNVSMEYEKRTLRATIDDKIRSYTPDFFLIDEDCYLELKGMKPGTSKISQQINSNSEVRDFLISQGEKIKILYMEDFYNELIANGLWKIIPNLERRNYNGTKHLIKTHSSN